MYVKVNALSKLVYNSMKTYTEDEMNQAIRLVESAKRQFPEGWAYLSEVGLDPPDEYVVYAFNHAKAFEARLKQETDRAVIYACGWLQGLSVGAALQR